MTARVWRWRFARVNEHSRLVLGINLHVWGVTAEFLQWTGYKEAMLRVGPLYVSMDWGSALHEMCDSLREG